MFRKDDSPGVMVMQQLSYWKFVKASYKFVIELGPMWQIPFCVTSVVFGGDREALRFVEKSMDLGTVFYVKSRI